MTQVGSSSFVGTPSLTLFCSLVGVLRTGFLSNSLSFFPAGLLARPSLSLPSWLAQNWLREGAVGSEPAERQVSPWGREGGALAAAEAAVKRLQLALTGPGSLRVICVQGNWCPELPASRLPLFLETGKLPGVNLTLLSALLLTNKQAPKVGCFSFSP